MTRKKMLLILVGGTLPIFMIGLSFAQTNISNTNVRGIGLSPKMASAGQLKLGAYRALIIGNDEYKDRNKLWKPLKTAVSDAKAVEALLKQQYGFSDVERLENASRKDILDSLRGLSKRVMKNDSVLLYYAGHGYLDEGTNKGFWVPVDAQGKDQTTYVRNSTIRDEISIVSERAQHTLLISDSCFSGSLLRGGNRGISVENRNSAYFEKIAAKKSVQIMAAGGVEYVDDDYKNSGHSPFTYFLMSELKNNDQDMLTATSLAGNVSMAVANNVNQVPESGVLQGAGDELGEFIFIKVNLEVAGIPKEKIKVIVEVNDSGATEQVPLAIQSKSKNAIRYVIKPIPAL